MKVHTARLQSAFRKVQQIREHMGMYCINGKDLPVCHRELHWAVKNYYGLEIEVHRMAPGGQEVRGMLLRRQKGHQKPTQIAVTTNQPEAWARFTQAKELAQVVIDEPEDWSVDGAQTLVSYIYETHIKNDEAASGVVQSEGIAFYAAIEIMYPYEYRLADAQAVAEKKTTLAKLALHYDLPENIIGRALHPSYMQLAKEIWGLVRG